MKGRRGRFVHEPATPAPAMFKTRLHILAWLLLIVSAMAIGGLALSLLGDARRSLDQEERETRRNRLGTVAEAIDLAVSEARSSLTGTLAGLPQADLAGALDAWRLENPLVRNVFVWSPSEGLVFPGVEAVSGEEADFRRRYAALFEGRSAWQTPLEETPVVTGLQKVRRELYELAQSAAPTEPRADRVAAMKTGWLPWYWEDGLHLLLWAERQDGQRFGLEIEMAALLARLVTVLPSPHDPLETLALLDDRRRVVHQSGDADPEQLVRAELAVPVSASLPHWQVILHRAGAESAAAEGLMLVGGLLTGVLVVAILLGGSLLLWQARQSQRDARRKTGFVANVSHELKTPLTTIRMYAEMLEETPDTAPERRHRYLQTIGSESRRLTRLVNNLLDFSRLEQGRKRYRREAINLRQLVERVLAGQTMRLNEAGVELTVDLALTEPAVVTDSDALEQVLLNLVDNVLKYAAAGGELHVALVPAGDRIELRVSDRGPGVPSDHAERVFDMFHRVDESLTTTQQGCGLGLSIARQMLRDLGGDLTYRTRDGGGACFVISLPTINHLPGETT